MYTQFLCSEQVCKAVQQNIRPNNILQQIYM